MDKVEVRSVKRYSHAEAGERLRLMIERHGIRKGDLWAIDQLQQLTRPALADALREAVRYALDVFSQYDGKHIMQALQFTDHIKKMAAALAERPVEGEKK